MTVYLDRRFRQVGRIKKSAGTTHKPTIKALNAMLDGLYNSGRLDVLRAIQKGTYTPLQVFEFYRINELEKLPTVATMGQLEAKMSAWIDDKECSEAHRRSLHQSLRHILAGKKSATVADLPELLESLRKKMKDAGHPRSFNLAKAAAQAFVKSTLKKNHPLYFEVGAMEVLRVTQQRKKTPLTPDEFYAVANKIKNSDSKEIARAMAFTGMGWTEYNGKWSQMHDRILIHGTKRKGRNRIVPRIEMIFFIERGYKAFRADLADAGSVTPYDLRRTYANWLEGAGIPRTRRKMYLGHGATDVTDLYERHEVEKFLAEDADRLRRFLGATETPALKLEKA